MSLRKAPGAWLSAVLIGLLGAALLGPAPARAAVPDARVLAGGSCGVFSCDVYVDRPTTQRLARAFRDWDKTSDVPTVFAASAACARLRFPLAFAACTTVITLTGSYFVDRVRQADSMGGCLRISSGLAKLPSVSAYNDDGTFCTGSRL